MESKSYTTMAEIKELATQTLQTLNCGSLVGFISIEFNNKFDSRLGDANYSERRIRLSAPLWPRATPNQRHDVIVHEICHIAVEHHAACGLTKDRAAHGNHWKQCMLHCGVAPERCHTVPTTGLRPKVQAFCNCREHIITKNKATKISNGRIYICLACKVPLRFKYVG